MDSETRYSEQRRKLVFELRKKGIRSWAILKAMDAVPRHRLVDKSFAKKAYLDEPLPIGEGQTISQPYTVAYQTQLLNHNIGAKVLEIGTGSGYQACILLELGMEVYTIERKDRLYERALKILPELGYNPHFFLGDGSRGLPGFAPFDNILVTAGAPDIPETLKNQLAVGGVMVIPVGTSESQKMIKITRKTRDDYHVVEYDHFRFVPLLGEDGW